MRVPFRRIPRRRAGEALLVAALLLAALAASLRFFVAGPERSAGGGSVGLTPAAGAGGGAGGLVSQNASRAGAGSSVGRAGSQPASGASGRASAGVTVPPAVTVTGAAALPSARVRPGYATPEDAVDGFYLALLSGTPARACAYVTTPCPSFGSRLITGQVSLVSAVSHDGEALVQVSGTICVGISCVPLTDRVAMPAGVASFSTSWTSLTSGVYGWAASPLPCVQDSATRQWHVRLAS